MRRTRGSQARRSVMVSACSVYWYWAPAERPPTRMSCTGCTYRFAPGSCPSLPRRRAITASALIWRCARGFSEMNMLPLLRWPPPVNPTTVLTAGSCSTTSTKWCSFSRIAWKEMA